MQYGALDQSKVFLVGDEYKLSAIQSIEMRIKSAYKIDMSRYRKSAFDLGRILFECTMLKGDTSGEKKDGKAMLEEIKDHPYSEQWLDYLGDLLQTNIFKPDSVSLLYKTKLEDYKTNVPVSK